SGAQEEVSLEIGVLDERLREPIGHGRAAATTSRATGSSFSASGDPSTNDTMEPSSKYTSIRSRRRPVERRYSTLPAKTPVPNPRSPRSLRFAIDRLLLAPRRP